MTQLLSVFLTADILVQTVLPRAIWVCLVFSNYESFEDSLGE